MSTLPNAAPVPSTPAEPVLPADAFTSTDLTEMRNAGLIFAGAIADISFHHITDPGSWYCFGNAPDEMARLHAALDQMAEAIQDARDWLTAIERRVRRAVAGRGGAK
ncbi:hypothetical protein [Virgisporangium aurantiacum]|uniref:Uncharacterized protein n=1 Tax=Virgisporangium aurantiacum TaxID=175570 RepID=A0A8J4DZC5_9ACTN|nr:hypothetical protein [Virgisporangium aurantiacum]GIJ53907.1 hypothetical protein Vau01_014230 [Virgisporangium aurantiacum]